MYLVKNKEFKGMYLLDTNMSWNDFLNKRKNLEEGFISNLILRSSDYNNLSLLDKKLSNPIKTNIAGLDRLLKGGLDNKYVYNIIGDVGSFKLGLVINLLRNHILYYDKAEDVEPYSIFCNVEDLEMLDDVVKKILVAFNVDKNYTGCDLHVTAIDEFVITLSNIRIIFSIHDELPQDFKEENIKLVLYMCSKYMRNVYFDRFMKEAVDYVNENKIPVVFLTLSDDNIELCKDNLYYQMRYENVVNMFSKLEHMIGYDKIHLTRIKDKEDINRIDDFENTDLHFDLNRFDMVLQPEDESEFEG